MSEGFFVRKKWYNLNADRGKCFPYVLLAYCLGIEGVSGGRDKKGAAVLSLFTKENAFIKKKNEMELSCDR